MLELMYIVFLLAVINFYLMIRKRNLLSATDKFMISLMSIFLLFFLFYGGANLFGDQLVKMMTPTFMMAFTITMNFVMPVITTEIVLAGYNHFVLNRKR